MDKPRPGSVLQTPKPGMKPLSPNMKPEDAYIAAISNLSIAVSALVDRMEDITEQLDGIGGELSVMSKYVERKGEKEGIWSAQDSIDLFAKEDGDVPQSGSDKD